MTEPSTPTNPIARAYDYLRQAWLVILLALLYGGALAGVQTTLGPKIAENKKKETYDRIPELVKGADQAQTAELPITGANSKSQIVYQANDADGQLIGWVLPASGLGFADRIDLLVGLDPQAATITGLYVLDQKETPGLGDNITRYDKFRKHFDDQPTTEPLMVVKSSSRSDPNAHIDSQIVALTGATISSESVVKIVNTAVENFGPGLRELAAESQSTAAEANPTQGGSD